MRRLRGYEPHATPRRAFTLVEILVVIAIIAILMAFIGVASVRAVRGARENATRTTIKKIDEMLSRRAAAFERALSGRQLAGGGRVESELMTKYDRIPDSPMKAKRLFQKFFGTSFGEESLESGTAAPASRRLPWTISDLGADELAELTAAVPPKFVLASHVPETENPEMLYWILVNGPTFGADAVEADSFSSSEVGDTDGDGLNEFIDAWGNPIRFYRWPTRLIRPAPPAAPVTPSSNPTTWAAQGSPYYELGRDVAPDDGQLDDGSPATYLIGSLPTYSVSPDESLPPIAPAGGDPSVRPSNPLGQDGDDEFGEILENYVREGGFASYAAAAQQFEKDYHTLNTWHALLIVSAGPDGDTGLFEPTDRANFGHLAQPRSDGSEYSIAIQDNITNLNSRASGTGGQ